MTDILVYALLVLAAGQSVLILRLQDKLNRLDKILANHCEMHGYKKAPAP